MAISSENVVVVYRSGDSESLQFAERYQQIHGLADEQLVSVPSSNIEVLDDYATFQSEVENPLLDALTSSSAVLLDFDIFAIVLMPRVPGGFHYGNEIISSTSRLSRIHHPMSQNFLNPLFDPKVFKRYGKSDSEVALVCSRFDSPQTSITEEWFNNTEVALRQLLVFGSFFMDPYSAYHRRGADKYEDELVSFLNGFIERLGLNVQQTNRVDPYVDPIITRLVSDSFYWGWGTEEGSLSFFDTSANLRGFFYNADFTGAQTMRDIDARNWPLLAIRQGYVATAGSMSETDIDNFLRPFPVFNTLFRGVTMGEAMIYAQPRLNTPIAVFGDPLLSYVFPFEATEETGTPENEAWQRAADSLAQAIAMIFRKNNILKQIRDDIISGNDTDVTLDLAQSIERLQKSNSDPQWKVHYQNLVDALFDLVVRRNKTFFPAHFPSLNDYLDETDGIIAEIVLDSALNNNLKSSISSNHVFEEGSWDFEFEIEDPTDQDNFAFFHFELDVSETGSFTEEDIIISKDSAQSTDGWFIENDDNVFEPIDTNGVTSNFVGKNIKYISQDGENLERGKFYYFRIRQKDQLTKFSYRTFREIIYK